MRVSTWLVLGLRRDGRGYKLVVDGARQTMPLDKMAAHVTLDIPEEVLRPRMEAAVAAHELKFEVSDAATE